jgi:cysteine desulfurase/selenocysteine lyase
MTLIEQLPEEIPCGGPPWLADLREQAISSLRTDGLPHHKLESWRFTPIARVARTAFAKRDVDRDSAVAWVDAHLGADGTHRVMLVNGDVARIPELPDGIEVEGLAEAIVRDPSLGQGLGQLVPTQHFAALNAALFDDGLVIRVLRGAKLGQPLHVVHLAQPGADPTAAYPRILVVAEPQSQATLIETYLAQPGAPHLVSAVTEVSLEDGARLEHVRVTEGVGDGHHIASVAVRQGRASSYVSRVVTLGGALSRIDLRLTLDGEGAEAGLYGVYHATGHDLVDHHTFIDHARPHCSSSESYSGIVDGRAHAVVDAMIAVRRDAQQTSAHQELHNLLLSDAATVNAKPHLEIDADDVACTHGATVGALDDDQLFYLRSRGIPEPRARAMLTYAFLAGAPDRRRARASAPRPHAPGGGGMIPALEIASEHTLARVRDDFPALAQAVHGKPLVYLDSASSSLTPQPVIDAITDIYARDRANVHRGVHLLSQRATAAYEGARDKVADFIGATSREEIIFVRGTTEAINLVATSWGGDNLREGDEILVTGLEHHSNIVPWQIAARRTGARLVVAPIADNGDVPLDEIERRIGPRTRMVAVAHVSNALGTLLPIADVSRLAHAAGAVVLVDGAQAVPHLAVDVAAIGCDFYAFSGHKLYGPTGIGVLWGRAELLDAMTPYQGGGDMIRSVTFEETTYNALPYRLEAGTPNIAGAAGLGAAVDYLSSVGTETVETHERDLLEYGEQALEQVPGLTIIGQAPHKLAVLSFTMDCAHPHDIGTIADMEGVAIRTGHHCAQPVMQRFEVPATARASLGVYNTRADIDALVRALHKAREIFA